MERSVDERVEEDARGDGIQVDAAEAHAAEDAEAALRVAGDGVADDERVVEARLVGGRGGGGEEAEPVEQHGGAARAGEQAEDGVVDGARVAVARAAAGPVEELEAEQQQRVAVGEAPRAVADEREDELLRERERLERRRVLGGEGLVDRVEGGERLGGAGHEEPVAEGDGDVGGRGGDGGVGILGPGKQRGELRQRRRAVWWGGGGREGVRQNGEEAAAARAGGERGEEAGHGGGGGKWSAAARSWPPAAVAAGGGGWHWLAVAAACVRA